MEVWYKGEEERKKRCPLCQQERVYAETLVFLGVDELLDVISHSCVFNANFSHGETSVRGSSALSQRESSIPVPEETEPFVPSPPRDIPSDYSDY